MIHRCFKNGWNRRKEKNNTHSYTQTWARQMWAATRGLQLFIMKGIHRSVPALPLSTQFFHTGPPSLPPCALPSIRPLFSLPSTFLSQPSLGQRRTECVEERARDKKWTERADLQDSLENSVGPCLSLLLPPVPYTGGGLCAQERLLYLGICGDSLGGGWRGRAPQASAPL